MDIYAEEWVRKGATLSDKTARAEFGLTQDEIIAAIRAGRLQYRRAEMQGNPWLRLLRREVEDLVSTGHGEGYLRERQARAELKQVNRELKQHRAQVAALEERRSALLAELGEQGALCGADRPLVRLPQGAAEFDTIGAIFDEVDGLNFYPDYGCSGNYSPTLLSRATGDTRTCCVSTCGRARSRRCHCCASQPSIRHGGRGVQEDPAQASLHLGRARRDTAA